MQPLKHVNFQTCLAVYLDPLHILDAQPGYWIVYRYMANQESEFYNMHRCFLVAQTFEILSAFTRHWWAINYLERSPYANQ